MPLSPYRYNAGAVAPMTSGTPLKATITGANGASPVDLDLLIGNSASALFKIGHLVGVGCTITYVNPNIVITVP